MVNETSSVVAGVCRMSSFNWLILLLIVVLIVFKYKMLPLTIVSVGGIMIVSLYS